MKIRYFIFSGCLLFAITLASCSKDEEKLNDTDRNFMVTASISNTAEINAANLAMTRATNTAVKAFAQQMLLEHNMAQANLKALGTSVNNPVKDTIDPVHFMSIVQLNTMSDRAFDSAYIHTQATDHELTLTNFKLEQNKGQHRDVKNYADTYLSHIKMHKLSADSIANAYYRR